MRKFLYAILAVLLLASPAFAISIPDSEQVINATGQEAVWKRAVYNNGSALDVGDVVVWDIANSTGDNDYYVKKVALTDTFAVAGVVYGNAIANGSMGIIAVRGIVDVDVTGVIASNMLLCTSNSGEKGTAQGCSGGTTDANGFGIAVATSTTETTTKAYIFGK